MKFGEQGDTIFLRITAKNGITVWLGWEFCEKMKFVVFET